MFDLMLGIDGVQQRTKRTFETRTPKAPKRRVVLVRVTVAAGLRALADRLEPVGAGRASEVAGAYPR
jgi:hypothetical protein